MTNRGKRSGISATELMAELQNDSEYQHRVRAAEAERQARAQGLGRAKQPVVADLRTVCVEVKSVWDLVNTSASYSCGLAQV